MKSQTDTANTKDWLDATQELTIRAYVETHVPTVSMPLDIELQAWDILSDEALKNFERKLKC